MPEFMNSKSWATRLRIRGAFVRRRIFYLCTSGSWSHRRALHRTPSTSRFAGTRSPLDEGHACLELCIDLQQRPKSAAVRICRAGHHRPRCSERESKMQNRHSVRSELVATGLWRKQRYFFLPGYFKAQASSSARSDSTERP